MGTPRHRRPPRPAAGHRRGPSTRCSPIRSSSSTSTRPSRSSRPCCPARQRRAAQVARRQEPALRLGGARPQPASRRKPSTSWACRASAFRRELQARLSAGRACRPHARHRERRQPRAWRASSACSTRRAGVDPVQGADAASEPPVSLSLDIGVQHAVAEELKRALSSSRASAAAGLVIDVATGEIVAAASLPEVDPSRARNCSIRRARPAAGRHLRARLGLQDIDHRAWRSSWALVDLDTVLDVRQPLTSGRFTIKDLYPQGRPLSVREVFLHSSNVGAGMLALLAGAERQRAFLRQAWAARGACARRPGRWRRRSCRTLGSRRDHHHRLWPRHSRGAAAVRGRRRRRHQWRREADADLPVARRRPDATARDRVVRRRPAPTCAS